MRRAVLLVVMAAVGCGGPARITESQVITMAPRQAVDILFLVDNSSGRDINIRTLPGLDAFFSTLGAMDPAHPVSVHLGVVTQDLGSNGFTDVLKQCVPGGPQNGGGGRLVRVGSAADPTCKPTVEPYLTLMLPSGETNAPSGQDARTTFDCMRAVGSNGCGFEQPLEATLQALTTRATTDNQGFLRDDAILAILYLTDEDDCSAPTDSNVFDAMPTADPPDGLGPLSSYRCAMWGIICDDPTTGQPALMPNRIATFSGCRPATAAEGSKLYDVSRYIDLFTKPKSAGGLKSDPNDIIVAAFAPPPSPVATVDFGGIPQLGMSCAAADAQQRVLNGAPAIRLSAVVDAVPNHVESTICQADLGAPLSSFASTIVSTLAGLACVSVPIDSHTTCRVTDASKQSVPRCDDGATASPCWRVVEEPRCTSQQRLHIEGTPTNSYTLTCSH